MAVPSRKLEYLLGALVVVYLLLGCKSERSGNSANTVVSVDSPTYEPPAQNPSDLIPQETGTRSGYIATKYGDDGNPMVGPSVNRVLLRKFICIADDLSQDYSSCRGQPSENSCLQIAKQKNPDESTRNRCEWFDGTCRPWSYGNCRRRSNRKDQHQFSKVIYLSDYIGLRKNPAKLAAEYAKYLEIDLTYIGHGPTIRDFSYIVQDAVSYADYANRISIKSLGCSTFKDLQGAKRVLAETLDQVHEAAKTRVGSGRLVLNLTGNQLLASDENTAVEQEQRIENSQTGATLQARIHADKFDMIEQSFYACRSEQDVGIASPKRVCFTDSSHSYVTKCQGPTGATMTERCGPYTLLFKKVGEQMASETARNSALVASSSSAFSLPVAESDRLPNLGFQTIGRRKAAEMTYSEASNHCEGLGKKLPSLWQLKPIVEDKDLFAWFRPETGINRGLVHGHVWAVDSAGPNEHYTYNLASAYPKSVTPLIGRLRASEKAFFICVGY